MPICKQHKRKPDADDFILSNEALEAKRMRRRLEARWCATNADTDKDAYRHACRVANDLMTKSRVEHYAAEIADASKQPGALWKEVNNILHPPRAPTYKTVGWCDKLADQFDHKVATIRANIAAAAAAAAAAPMQLNPTVVRTLRDRSHVGPMMSDFAPVSIEEVRNIINNMPNKTSPMDFIPTELLKACSIIMFSMIAHVANLCFDLGCFPTAFKHSQVTPILKKPNLDGSDDQILQIIDLFRI